MQQHSHSAQRGFALLILLALIGVMVGAAILTFVAKDSGAKPTRLAQTEQALSAAKQALIAYAAGVQVSATACLKKDSNGNCARLGDLPCPDLNNDGWADGPCNGKLIGRLPWKTLGLPDLRDGDGERLWYAVSAKFVENPRATSSSTACPAPQSAPNSTCTCPSPAQTSCLNSSTSGFITVRNSAGLVVNDGTKQAGAVAVIIAPGAIVTRLDQAAPQNRTCTGDSNITNCQKTNVCTGAGTAPNIVYTGTALCNPINYLEIAKAPVLSVSGTVGNQEDNANFTEGGTTNGFISGPIADPTVTGSNPPVKINDVIMTVKFSDVMAAVQRRVAQEVLTCLSGYGANQGGTFGNGRYPWAVDIPSTTFTVTSAFVDKSGTYFGRVPDNGKFTKTSTDSGGTMSSSWPANCNLGGSWWVNWKDVVFYGVAAGYAPASTAPATCTGSTCLTVSPLAGNKRVVVMVAGPAIGTQTRSTTCSTTPTPCNTLSNYLEGTNATATGSGAGAWAYQSGSPTSTFNDLVVYQ